VALAVLAPIVASQGGNAATQTMTVAVRALATRELGSHNALRVVLREVLVPGGPMRSMFLREFPERLAPLVERAVRSEIERGALRSDLDPKLLVLSVVSLAVFPFLGFPLTSRVFGVRNDEEFVTRFLRHTQALLACGVAPGASPA